LLNSPTANDDILETLGNEFYGSKVGIDVDHLASLFMIQN